MADFNTNFQRMAMARRLGFGGTNLDSTTAMRAWLNNPVHANNAARKDLNTEAAIQAQYTKGVLTDSPVHYWRLGDTSPFADSGSGSKTASGTVTTGVTGPMFDANAAITLNGSQSLATAVTDPLTGATACSLEMWVKSAGSWPASTEVVVNPGNIGHYLGINSSGAAFVSLIISGVQRTLNDVNIIIPVTGWHHVVATWATGSAIRIYQDGVLLVTSGSTFAGSLDASTGGVCLGAFNTAAPSLFFTGSLDEPAVYTTQLSATQVATHYAGR